MMGNCYIVCKDVKGLQGMKKIFGNILGSKKQELKATDDYTNWRKMVFSLQPESAQVSSKEIDRVFGIVMDDVKLDEASNTLWAISQTAFASGESSLKSTVGMGVIGLGVGKNEENIFTAVQQLVELAQQLFNFGC